jgi:hypothetical protein
MSTDIKSQNPITLNVKVQFNPSDAELQRINGLYRAIDTLIVHNGFRNENIMKPQTEKLLFCDWTIVSIGKHRIPAPIHTVSKTKSILYNWDDQPIELTNKECAYVTALYYVEMLCMIRNDWDHLCSVMPPLFRISMCAGVEWVESLSPEDYRDIIYSLKMQLSSDGHYVLN